jgi:hypothetical protein
MQVICARNKHVKKHVGCPLKLILRFSRIFYISNIKQKYLYTIMYDYEKSALTHELSYIKLFNFSHLSLFLVMLFVKNSSKKSLNPFFLFWYPNYEWTHETYNQSPSSHVCSYLCRYAWTIVVLVYKVHP